MIKVSFLCLLAVVWIALPAQGALRVTIDPGHGGEEQGAVHDGVVESKVALQISKKLYQRLQKDKNFKVQLLRHNDKTLELEKRVEKSKAFATDLFISIHANANPNPKAQGTEFYIQNQLDIDEEAMFLAHMEHDIDRSQEEKPKGDVEAILYDLKKSHKILKSYQVGSFLKKNWPGIKSYPVRQGPFYVLSQNEVPAVLVEVGYLSNPRERQRLTQKDYQNQIVQKIHNGLKDYAKNIDKLP